MMDPRAPAAAICLMLLSGCMVDQKPADGEDIDGDFLIDERENAGWNVTVSRQFVGCGTDYEAITYHVTSNPKAADTDRDGLDDSDENLWFSDPRNTDTDGDGLSDKFETDFTAGSDVAVKGVLRPTLYDSDGDCLSDGQEINGTEVPGLGMITSDPSVRDGDHDGLSDWDELHRTRTDPRRADTDGDGAEDRRDIDPRRNIALRLTFESVRVKSDAAPDGVRFWYRMDAVPTDVEGSDGEAFQTPRNQNVTVPDEQSPGRVDVDDVTLFGSHDYSFQWGLRTKGGLFLNLTSGSADKILTLVVDPVAGTWTTGSQQGRADGGLSRVGASDADVWFRLFIEQV